MSMKQTIETKLGQALSPAHLVVQDESHMHNVPEGAESHFNVFVVADAFEGKRLIARHQAVYAALKEEMAGRIHALALKTLTQAEWVKQGGGAAVSPPCLGGSKADG
jgi:BolA protein